MKFSKGSIPWNKGKKCPQISAVKIGKKRPDMRWNKLSIGKIPWNKGKKGEYNLPKHPQTTEESRKKMSIAQKKRFEDKTKHPRWKGGISTYENKLAHNNARRVRKSSNGGSHTIGEWENLRAQYNWKCACCREEKTLTRDHIIPISKGGSDNIENIQPLCKNCNSKKHTQTTKF